MVVEAVTVAEAEVIVSESFDGRAEREAGTDVTHGVDPK
jgi:hypothetical protein